MTIKKVTKKLAKRYMKMLPTSTIEYRLARKIVSDKDNLPIDKLSRWIGFIQASCIHKKLTTIAIERDFSRPLFHKAYIDMDIEIPKTISV